MSALLEEAILQFQEDPDVDEALCDWMRGFENDKSVLERLIRLRDRAVERAASRVAEWAREKRMEGIEP